MRKTLSAFVVVFALFAGVVPANAQGCLFNECGPADELILKNQRMVGRWMNYGGNWYYGYNQGGNFYGLYDIYRRPLPRKIRIPLAAFAGYSIGRGIGGNRGGWIGLGAAVAGELIYDAVSNRGGSKGEEMAVLSPDQIPPPPTGGPQTPSSRENGWNDILRRQKTSTYQRGQIGGRPVNNRTGLDVLLWVGDSEEAIEISRGGHTKVPRNPGGLEAETVETALGGDEVRKPALVVPNHDLDGWDIIVPARR